MDLTGGGAATTRPAALNARSTASNTSNALYVQAAQRRLATSTAATDQGGLGTQNTSRGAASMPVAQPSDMQAALDRIAALEAELQAARALKKRGRPPGKKDTKPRKKRAQVTQKTSTEDD